ncbi:MAG: D-glycero-beta-D-manno-heptose 1,7-bisphosphate 7-phosphatase [Proteobacteria bacterium]|nr:D-glycero-beta-D-manno-heptose 1,7-bisphosphate 7-phosphatase [Pseudomonadota bacterium]
MTKRKLLKNVVFIDRDGAINRNSPDYIKSWSEFEFLPGSIDAIKLLNLNGFVVIIITNQSVINRNMVSLDGLEYINSMMKSAFKSGGGEIKDIFYCPHIPEDRCDCRKPEPGLIYRAQKTYHIDLANSVMVGDSVKDIMCARNAGCGLSILVKTGNGVDAEKILAQKKIFPDYVAENLLDAAKWIVSQLNIDD